MARLLNALYLEQADIKIKQGKKGRESRSETIMVNVNNAAMVWHACETGWK